MDPRPPNIVLPLRNVTHSVTECFFIFKRHLGVCIIALGRVVVGGMVPTSYK